MRIAPDLFGKSPEAVLVSLSRTGNRDAFAELVTRRQVWIRNLMRRCSGNAVLADDLSQQVFMQAWRAIRQLQDGNRFGPWLKRVAINVWLQHQRKNDALHGAVELIDADSVSKDTPGVAMDLDQALGALPDDVRLCIVLSYHEQMTHKEIAAQTGIPLGTVKSHIRRGSKQLQERLAAYAAPVEETNDD